MCLFPNKSQIDGDMPMVRPPKKRTAQMTREEASRAADTVEKKADYRKGSDEVQKSPTKRVRPIGLHPFLEFTNTSSSPSASSTSRPNSGAKSANS